MWVGMGDRRSIRGSSLVGGAGAAGENDLAKIWHRLHWTCAHEIASGRSGLCRQTQKDELESARCLQQ
jgi:hypothetical protein